MLENAMKRSGGYAKTPRFGWPKDFDGQGWLILEACVYCSIEVVTRGLGWGSDEPLSCYATRRYFLNGGIR